MNSGEGEKIKVRVDPDIAGLIPAFLKRRKSDVADILAALKTGDLECLRTLGHQMKGSGAGYGFLKISEIGALIEREAAAGQTEKIPALAVQLEDYLQRIEVIFE